MSRKERRMQKKIKNKKIVIIISSIAFIICATYIGYYIYNNRKDESVNEKLVEYIKEENIIENETKKSEFLAKLGELKKQNSDLIGWIEIPDTNINYPVVQTDNNDYYVNHNFEKQKSSTGTIFLHKDCDITKPSNNLIIYGHRTTTGTMFETLTKYKNEEFYKEHKTFKFSTLEEEAEYKIIAVFRSQVFYENQNVFKYYKFKGTEKAEEFENYVDNIKKLCLYNIEDTAEFGDELITLTTCDYYMEDGRFVVVAKKILK